MSTTAPETGIIEERWDITYRHSTGSVASAFYAGLHEGRIHGVRCPECERVLVPPRSFCDRDYATTEGWLPVGPDGVLETFTVVYRKFRSLPDPPYAIAYVRLAGADTAILSYLRDDRLGDVDWVREGLAVGTPLRAVFAPAGERAGRMTDFWFELAGP